MAERSGADSPDANTVIDPARDLLSTGVTAVGLGVTIQEVPQRVA